jgi:hypothetical protein
MVRDLSLEDKKGVSIMIGYVLLIVIAISLSALVYAYLMLYLPSTRAQCPEGVNLIISEPICSGGSVMMTIENRGLRSVEMAYIRIGETGRLHKTNLGSGGGPFSFAAIPGESRLDPGRSIRLNFQYTGGAGPREIEVQPVMMIENKMVLCGSVSTQAVSCS